MVHFLMFTVSNKSFCYSLLHNNVVYTKLSGKIGQRAIKYFSRPTVGVFLSHTYNIALRCKNAQKKHQTKMQYLSQIKSYTQYLAQRLKFQSKPYFQMSLRWYFACLLLLQLMSWTEGMSHCFVMLFRVTQLL